MIEDNKPLKWEDNWEKMSSIGGGGQGETFRVKHKKTDELMGCLKILRPDKNSEKSRSRFSQEALLHKDITHSGIPKLLESNAFDKVTDQKPALYLITELVDGETLTNYVNGCPVQFIKALNIFIDLCDIVHYVHEEKDFVHRDIKPDNIIIRNDEHDTPVLLDFGISYMPEYHDGDDDITEGEELGNRFLRLPELSTKSADKRNHKSDIAFLGGILFYLLTGGHKPSIPLDENGNMPHQRENKANNILKNAVQSEYKFYALYNIFCRCFSHTLDGRYDSVEELIKDIKELKDMSDTPQHNDDISYEDIARCYRKNNPEANMIIQHTCNDAITHIFKICRTVCTKTNEAIYAGLPAIKIGQTGYERNGSSVKNTFHYFENTTYRKKKSSLVKIEASAIGSELVISRNDQVIYRTSISQPKYSEEFDKNITNQFKQLALEIADT